MPRDKFIFRFPLFNLVSTEILVFDLKLINCPALDLANIDSWLVRLCLKVLTAITAKSIAILQYFPVLYLLGMGRTPRLSVLHSSTLWQEVCSGWQQSGRTEAPTWHHGGRGQQRASSCHSPALLLRSGQHFPPTSCGTNTTHSSCKHSDPKCVAFQSYFGKLLTIAPQFLNKAFSVDRDWSFQQRLWFC